MNSNICYLKKQTKNPINESNLFGLSAAAPDYPECERKPETSNTEIQQFTGVYGGLSTVVLLFCCFSFIYSLHRKQNFYSKLSDACPSVSI